MAVSFKIPKQPRKSIDVIDTFLGADFSNSPAGADKNKSPGLKNMIRDVPGKIRKCMGYETVKTYTPYDVEWSNFILKDQTYDYYDLIHIHDGLIDISFSSASNSGVTLPRTLFDQKILEANFKLFNSGSTYSSTPNLINLIFSNKEIPEFITGISIFEMTYQGTNYYQLSLDWNGHTGDSIEGLELKLYSDVFLENITANSIFIDDYYVQKADYEITVNASSGEVDYLTLNGGDINIFEDLTSAYTNQDLLKIYYEYFKDENKENLSLDIKGYIANAWFSNECVNDFEYIKIAYENNEYVLKSKVGDIIGQNYFYFTLVTTPQDMNYDGRVNLPINGYHKLRKDDTALIHVGTCLMRGDELLYDTANNRRSMSWEFDEHLYIVDGKKFLRYGLNDPQSDTKYKDSKTTNYVVVNDEITLVVKRFNKRQNILKVTDPRTSSINGKFAVNKDKTEITYTDKLTEIGQDVTYSCTYEYRKGSSGSKSTGTITTHHLIAISDVPAYEVIPVEDVAYVPLLTIAKAPDGGGESYWDLNMLTPGFTEWFLPKQKYDSSGQIQVGVWQDDYYMSFDELDEVEPIVKLRNLTTGEWVEQTLGTDYTVDYSLGLIHFTTAPSLPIDERGEVLQAEDTVSITVYKTFDDYSSRINKCTIGTLFGVGGANDRLFLSGNPDYPNYDWYSGAYILDEDDKDSRKAREDYATPNYFPDTGYSTLGSSASAIVGYSRVSNYLAAHKDKFERDQHIIIREGDMTDSTPTFRIINTLQGAAAVAPYSFGYLATEPLFLTEQGIYAVTAQDITGEKYAQNRSFYLDGKLLEEENLENAYGFVYNDMYWLCLNDVAYILDGLQPMRSDKAEPYATRQYAGFYRTNIPANVMWEEDGRLFFGTKDGKVKRFYKDKYALESYNDDGEPIEAIWETGDLTGNVFFKNKTLHHIAVKLDSAIAASVNIFVMWRGLWNFVRTDHWRARQFQFSTEEFQYHTFSNDKTQRVVPKKVRFKNVDKFRLRLTNNELNESFALSDVGIEFTETDNYTR